MMLHTICSARQNMQNVNLILNSLKLRFSLKTLDIVFITTSINTAALDKSILQKTKQSIEEAHNFFFSRKHRAEEIKPLF